MVSSVHKYELGRDKTTSSKEIQHTTIGNLGGTLWSMIY